MVCVHNNSSVPLESATPRYNEVWRNLRYTERRTVFGKVDFDKWQQNKGNKYLTVQILRGNHSIGPTVVLPELFSSGHQFQFPGANIHKPLKCPAGQSATNNEFHPCKKCPPGRFSDVAGLDFCKDCGLSAYNPNAGATSCIPCPDLTRSTRRTAKSLGECVCQMGAYLIHPENMTCAKCPQGGICEGGSTPPYPRPGSWGVQNFRWAGTDS
ncbi:unnamed protein product [Ostreobium quekettii]|uniref:Tyrosine-protein kinase ephrin type A/B receptor-like domain-containing protein n=1 Tax=Ostreobium quekettii TaxID=121088 RepID=A0A8S1JGE8_9CHLO|nr:unnamed protein product [Ostreobium quekettii]